MSDYVHSLIYSPETIQGILSTVTDIILWLFPFNSFHCILNVVIHQIIRIIEIYIFYKRSNMVTLLTGKDLFKKIQSAYHPRGK